MFSIKMWFILTFLTFLSSFDALALKHSDVFLSNTSYSKQLKLMQTQFQDAAPARKILLMDQDFIQINGALNGIANLKQRNQFLSYYAQKTMPSAPLTEEFFKGLQGDTLSGINTVIEPNPHNDSSKEKICLVFTNQHTQELDTQLKSFLSLNKRRHGDISNRGLLNTFNIKDFSDFTNFHEIGHCFDKHNHEDLLKADYSKNSIQYIKATHKMESFADVFAILMMARQGLSDIGEEIAALRTASAALQGPYSVKKDDPLRSSYYTNVTYYTHNSIIGAMSTVDHKGASSLQELSLAEIAELAHEITEATTVNFYDLMGTLEYFYLNQYKLDSWEMLKKDFEIIAKRYPLGLKIRQEMELSLRRLIDFNDVPTDVMVLDQLAFREDGSIEPQVISNDLTDKLVQEIFTITGGRKITRDKLAVAFSTMKNTLRQDLSNPAKSQLAHLKLSKIGTAFLHAAQQLDSEDRLILNKKIAPSNKASDGNKLVKPKKLQLNNEEKLVIEKMKEDLFSLSGGPGAKPIALKDAYTEMASELLESSAKDGNFNFKLFYYLDLAYKMVTEVYE